MYIIYAELAVHEVWFYFYAASRRPTK